MVLTVYSSVCIYFCLFYGCHYTLASYFHSNFIEGLGKKNMDARISFITNFNYITQIYGTALQQIKDTTINGTDTQLTNKTIVYTSLGIIVLHNLCSTV